MQHEDAVGQLADEGHVVLDDHRAGVEPAADPANGLDDFAGLGLRQAGGRFVEQDQPRLGDQHHDEFEDLALAVRQIARPAVLVGQEGEAGLRLAQDRARPGMAPHAEEIGAGGRGRPTGRC